jgi:hypothetical protein
MEGQMQMRKRPRSGAEMDSEALLLKLPKLQNRLFTRSSSNPVRGAHFSRQSRQKMQIPPRPRALGAEEPHGVRARARKSKQCRPSGKRHSPRFHFFSLKLNGLTVDTSAPTGLGSRREDKINPPTTGDCDGSIGNDVCRVLRNH